VVDPVDKPAELTVFDPATGRELLTIRGLSAAVFSLAFSPDGHRLVAGLADGSIVLYDAADGQELLTLRTPADAGSNQQVTWVSFSTDGHRLASYRPGFLHIWDGTPEPNR